MNYIYTLTDPLTNQVRYVGKTNNIKNRLKQHIINSKNKKTHKDTWIQQLVLIGVNPEIEVLDSCVYDWENLEIYWISQLKSWGFDLVNSTDGGENPPLLKSHSEKTKLELSKIKKEYYKNNPHHRLGSKNSIEHINKIKLKKSERNYSIADTTREKLSKSHLKDGGLKCYQYNLSGDLIKEWNSVNEASKFFNTNKILLVCRGKRKKTKNFIWSFNYYGKFPVLINKPIKNKYVYTDEHKKNISKANKGKKRTDEFKKNISKLKTGFKHSDETKKLMSEKRINKKIHTDEYKNKLKVKVIQLDLNGNIIKIWDSITDAKHKFPFAKISECIYNKRKTSYGYRWKKI